MPAGTPKQPRIPLARERIIDAALTLADERGLDACSMRSLGQRLGVEAMSLYNHVANKDDVIDAIFELVVGEIEPAATTGPWLPALRASAVSARTALVRHPWACSQWLQRMPGPNRLRYMEGLLACLARSGLPEAIAHHAYHVIDTYIVGFTAQQATFTIDTKDLDAVATDFLRDLPVGDFPHVAMHVHQHLADDDSTSAFEFGLDLILHGLDRARPTR